MKPSFRFLPEKRIGYLVIRKSGCTSLLAALDQIDGITPTQPSADSLLGESELPDDAPRFTFVREPVHRFLSFYANKIARCNSRINVFERPERNGFQPNMNLDQAIDALTCGAFEPEAHVVAQSALINACSRPPEFTGRLESFGKDLQRIQDQFGLQVPALHLNRNPNACILPSQEQYDRLAEYYRADLETFGYPNSYSDWLEFHQLHQANTTPVSDVFLFKDEARMLRFDSRFDGNQFHLKFRWQLLPGHQRWRVARIFQSSKDEIEGQREILFRARPERNLRGSADDQQIVDDSMTVPLRRLPANVDPRKLMVDVCFWNPEQKAASLVNYALEGVVQKRLEFPLFSYLAQHGNQQDHADV